MKKAALIFSVLLCTSLLFGCGQAQSQQASKSNETKKELVVGMELAYPPFEMTDTKGNPCGISVDLAKDLGKSLGRPVRIENMAFSGLIPALQTKKIDCIISSMTITDERKKSIAFSDPYAKAWLALLINKNSPVKEIKDLNVKGRIVAIKKGTVGQIYAQKYLPNAQVNIFDKEDACALEVTQGKADAFIYDTLSVDKLWKQNQSTTRANLKPFEENIQQWGIGMRKDDTELVSQVNKFLKDYKSNGGFNKLSDKYLGQEKKDFKEQGIQFFFD